MKTNLFKPKYIFTLAVVLLLVVSVMAVNPTSQADRSQEIVNRTSGFQVVQVVPGESEYTFLLKNNYNKAITGYSVGTGDGRSHMDTDLTIGDRIIASGDVEKINLPVSQLQTQTNGSPQQSVRLVVLAVMFEDGTSDGDARTISRFEHRRIGRLIQFNRILPALEALLSSTDSQLPDAIKRISEQVSLLAEEPDTGMPPDVKVGLISGKQDLEREIQRLAQADASRPEAIAQIRREIVDVRGRITKRIARMNGSKPSLTQTSRQ